MALGIAITKATLVVLFFMHAKYSSRLTKLFVGTAFFFLLILLALTMTDFLSRGLRTYPGGAPVPATACARRPHRRGRLGLELPPRAPRIERQNLTPNALPRSPLFR